MDVDEFWLHYETTASDFEDLQEAILQLSGTAATSGRILGWRGQADSSWALHSKLYREFIKAKPSGPPESEFANLEKRILTELRRWGLHSQRSVGRLSVLSQLAMLQHFGAPTRLLDISFNALIGAFFAVEDGRHNDKDARLFAIDITGGLINDRKRLRRWEDSIDTPWSESFIAEDARRSDVAAEGMIDFEKKWRDEWTSHIYAWKPPALDGRISAQNGGFVFGGVVGTRLREGFLDSDLEKSESVFQMKEPGGNGAKLSIGNARKITCLAMEPNSIPKRSARNSARNSVYSIRIAATAKKQIREKLESVFGYTHAVIYPDFPGFAEHGVSKILRGA